MSVPSKDHRNGLRCKGSAGTLYGSNQCAPPDSDYCSTEYAFLFVVLLLVCREREEVGASRDLPARYARFFRALGNRVRSHRMERGLTQEDMISYGFSLRHWQMIEAGRPVTVVTLLRVCDTFDISLEELVSGLSQHFRKVTKP